MYELNKEERKRAIDELVLLMQYSIRDKARKTANNLADLFEGQDLNAVGLLHRAAETGKFDYYVKKLQDYYRQEGQNVSVDIRSVARNWNIGVLLRDIVEKETQIADKTRPRTDRKYWPKKIQILARYLGSVKMELFFADCFKELTK
jgi:predicted RNA-binding protein with RPS1 domain